MILAIDIETVPQPGIMDTWYPEWAREKHPDKTDQEIEAINYAYRAMTGKWIDREFLTGK